MIAKEQVAELLERIRGVTVAVCGDFALDAYWILDPGGSEVSVETGLQAQAVSRHYYSPGGASNVVANLQALEPREIRAIGVIGDDPFGRELNRVLERIGVNVEGLVVQEEGFDTLTYAKRYLDDEEQPRIDFGFPNRRTMATDEQILRHLEDALRACEAVIFNQQVPGSLNNEEFIEGVAKLFRRYDDRIVVLDSRHYGHRFENVYRKLNSVEAARLNGVEADPEDVIELEDAVAYGQALFERSGKPVFMTQGDRGLLVFDAKGCHVVPGIEHMKEVDPVGAGDTVTSALGASLGAGASPEEAAEFANYAAAVTVQKLFRTGTASADEILEACKNPDFLYQPSLAEDRRRARYIEGTEVEMCYDLASIPTGRVRHAVFDHDGTISLIRQGWQVVMQDVMERCILGDAYQSASEKMCRRVRERVREYIEKSTGVQTIIQMEHLVELVSEFGLVPEKDIGDKWHYKGIYNDALMRAISGRIEALEAGRLAPCDFMLKGSQELLEELVARGVTLYLASGTDREDVVREAAVLGHAHLFEGRIYGAVRDVKLYSKRQVIQRIIQENGLDGPELAVFGDGPVEMRECRRAGGFAVGVASDEVRRHGLDPDKRRRLIRAGAHLVTPDFSWQKELLKLLFEER
jgi:rfaE bifunctional protein kinase chain/domain